MMFSKTNKIGPLVRTSPVCDNPGSLTERLEEFYNTTEEYTAFTTPSDQQIWLEMVGGEIKRKCQDTHTKVRVLEAGAGCGSVFRQSEGLDRKSFHYTAQDITRTNVAQLGLKADAVHIGPLQELDGKFEVVFSLFVLEHVASPGDFLAQMDRLLTPGGTHLLVCPRYDVPGYVCPSMRHLGRTELLKVEARRHLSNLLSRYGGGEPAFWVNTDPALFHKKWRRDTDAVHIVSQNEVALWHSKHGYQTRKLRPKTVGLVDFFVKRMATTCLAFDKRG